MSEPPSGIYCHCALVFNCAPATSEVQDQNGLWVPVCERCMRIAWHDRRRVRSLQRRNYIARSSTVKLDGQDADADRIR